MLFRSGDTADNQTQTSIRLVLYPKVNSPYQTLVVIASLKSIAPDKNQIELTNPNPSFTQALKLSTKIKSFDKDLNLLKLANIKADTALIGIILLNKDKDTATLTQLVANLTSPAKTSSITPKCGDGICTADSANPESPETCPADCTKP